MIPLIWVLWGAIFKQESNSDKIANKFCENLIYDFQKSDTEIKNIYVYFKISIENKSNDVCCKWHALFIESITIKGITYARVSIMLNRFQIFND